ncbi:MAG: hypothetical protein M0024_05725 [Nitrospiraceae bacterium]|nr:hypothetical protein [Nitrospiraceae bacterium]
MSSVDVLCGTDREMMLDFSSLCLKRLNSHLPLRLFLSPFRPFLDANVHKEIEKDRLIIEHAAEGFGKEGPRPDRHVERLFEMTKEVDAEFLKKWSGPFLSIEIRYDDVAAVRKQRIRAFSDMVHDLLSHWDEELSFSGIVKKTYTQNDYKETLGQLLHLYTVETKLLGGSLVAPGPAGALKAIFSGRVFSIMEEAACEVADMHARRAYMDGGGATGVAGTKK